MNYPLICTEGRNDENKHGNCSTTNAGGNGDVCLKKKSVKQRVLVNNIPITSIVKLSKPGFELDKQEWINLNRIRSNQGRYRYSLDDLYATYSEDTKSGGKM